MKAKICFVLILTYTFQLNASEGHLNFWWQQKKQQYQWEKDARKYWYDLTLKERKKSPWVKWYRKNLVRGLLKFSMRIQDLANNNVYPPYSKNKTNIKNCEKFYINNRAIDGSCNDLINTEMGSVYTRYSRNVSDKNRTSNRALIFYPNPREISRKLLKRKKFKPNKKINLLGVAWIQFIIHDITYHNPNKSHEVIPLPLLPGDPLGDYLQIPMTKKEIGSTNFRPTYLNHTTHWVDGSQLYGRSKKESNRFRAFKNGEMKLDDNLLIPRDARGNVLTAGHRNWWAGLSFLHHTMIKEHNAIAKKILKDNPYMTDWEIYNKAKMVVAALIVKITIKDYLPALNQNRIFQKSLKFTWNSLGKKRNQDMIPYAASEDFVSLYRFHSMLPDYVGRYSLDEMSGQKGEDNLRKMGPTRIARLLGRNYAGKLSLKNYPSHLRNIDIPLLGKMDLATIDIVRDRERGVPRYNNFRRSVNLTPLKKFSDFGVDAKTTKILKEVYQNDIELVDLMIGFHAESIRPTGFTIPETVFHVASVMVGRKITCDRFFQEGFTAENYSQTGMDWIEKNNLNSILIRHYPSLKSELNKRPSPFYPWK